MEVGKPWAWKTESSNASTSNQLKWRHVFLFIKRKPWDGLNGHRHYPLILSQPFVPFSFTNLWDLVPVRPASIPPRNLVLTDQLLLYLSLILPHCQRLHIMSRALTSNELFSIAACSPLLVPYAHCPSETQVQKVETRWLSVLIELNRNITVNYPYPHRSWFYVWGLTVAM